MIDTLLFDLDGTLLAVDTYQLMRSYYKGIKQTFEGFICPQTIRSCICTSYKEMLENSGVITNQEALLNSLEKFLEDKLEQYKAVLEDFYCTGFKKNQRLVRKVPEMIDSIKILKEKCYQMVIVTNPIYPINAVISRLQWAGLNPDDFSYISSCEHNHFCKPSLQLFLEIARDIDKAPEQCILVGNDIQEDIIASQIGMKTYLVTNYLINREKEDYECTYSGTFEDFLSFVRGLPPVMQNICT